MRVCTHTGTHIHTCMHTHRPSAPTSQVAHSLVSLMYAEMLGKGLSSHRPDALPHSGQVGRAELHVWKALLSQATPWAATCCSKKQMPTGQVKTKSPGSPQGCWGARRTREPYNAT